MTDAHYEQLKMIGFTQFEIPTQVFDVCEQWVMREMNWLGGRKRKLKDAVKDDIGFAELADKTIDQCLRIIAFNFNCEHPRRHAKMCRLIAKQEGKGTMRYMLKARYLIEFA